jgi:hypothetical protein
LTLRPAHVALLCLATVAGCSDTVYLSSPTPSMTQVPAGTATPTPILSSSPPSASPTPPGSSEGSAEVFFAQFGAVPPPFHVQIATTLTGAPSGTALEEADVDGADYTAELHVELGGAAAQDSRIVVVDETAYVADAGSNTWRAYPDYQTVPPVNPFLDLDPVEWQDMGPDSGRGGLERLHSTTWRPPDTTLADRVNDVVFDVWIDDEGLPMSAQLSFTLTAADGASSVSYDATYTFSKIGESVEIVLPVESPGVASPSPS